MAEQDRFRDNTDQGVIELIAGLARGASDSGMSIREMRDRLDERGSGVLILVLSIPCLVPALYGVPQIVGIPIIILAAQVMVGRKEPWLPKAILDRNVPKAWMDRMADFAEKRMGWFERLSRPRLQALAGRYGERVVGAFMILATLTIILPMTNSIPSLALALMALGLIQRDGIFVGIGALVALAWAGLLATLGIGFLMGAGWAVAFMARLTG